MKDGDAENCSNFDPKKWDKKKVTWKEKLFVKDKAIAFFHIPLNIKSVIKRGMEKIRKADAVSKETMILSDENHLFSTNIYISTKKMVPKVHDVKVSGVFLTRVFEGSYKNMNKWKKEMESYVKLQKKELKHLYYYYPTHNKESKEKKKNYVILLAEI